MKIALAQTDIIWEDKDSNRLKAEDFILKASKENVDLILFPEMTLTGFSMNVTSLGEKKEGDTLQWFKKQAVNHNICIGFGYIEKIFNVAKGKNNYAIIDRNGHALSIYSKIHPFSFGKEAEFYEGGNDILLYEIDNCTVSSFICYDLRFPEIFQIASKKAQLITVAANWPEQRISHWQALLKSRAIENQCYILGINRTGYGDNIKYSGSSMVIDPKGNVILKAEDKEELLICEIDLTLVSDTRSNFKLKLDRREKLYLEYYKNIIDKD